MKVFSVAVLACTLLITGCAVTHKPSDRRKAMTPVEFSSAKSAKAVALCVADEWEKIDNYFAKVQLRPTTNGYSVWIEASIGTMMKDDTATLADIDDVQNGSITRFYTVAGSDIWKLALDKCLGDIPAKAITPQSSTSEVQTTTSNSTSQKLRELQGLRKDGVITEDEFQKKKKQLLEKL